MAEKSQTNLLANPIIKQAIDDHVIDVAFDEITLESSPRIGFAMTGEVFHSSTYTVRVTNLRFLDRDKEIITKKYKIVLSDKDPEGKDTCQLLVDYVDKLTKYIKEQARLKQLMKGVADD